MAKKTKKVVKKKVLRKPIKKKPARVAKKEVSVKNVVKEKIVKRKIMKKKTEDNISADTVHKTKVRVIGIGGGGGTIVSEIISTIKKADFVIANTDDKALRSVRHAKKFQFGLNITKGLGTGMNVEIGEAAALEEKEKIAKLFEGQDICIMISSLGGGTGSGSTPVFAKLSKSSGCLTFGIFTMPFEFEGEKKMEIAREALDKIRPHLNAFSVIPNERIFKIIDKNTPLKDALSAINGRLAQNLAGLIEMIYSPGLINIDFADIRTILSGRGKLAYLNSIEINEPDKEEAVKKIISSPLYSYTIKGSKGAVFNIVGGKAIQLSEVSRISRIVSESVNRNAKIIFGINQEHKNSDKMSITLLATGCSTKDVIPKPSRKKIIKIIKKVIAEPIPVVQPEPEVKEIKKKIVKKKPIPKPQPEVGLPSVDKAEVVQVRRNALEVKKAVEEEENEFVEKEKVWEIPAILRKNKND